LRTSAKPCVMPTSALPKSRGSALPKRPSCSQLVVEAARSLHRLHPETRESGSCFLRAQLHHLLLSDLGLPVVATSGNLSEEPIALTEEEAQRRLGTDRRFPARSQSPHRSTRGRQRACGHCGAASGLAPCARVRAAPHPMVEALPGRSRIGWTPEEHHRPQHRGIRAF
ncbi:MAG: Sua5/YciO/YrdC/YwlC family protein, partial [Polyangiaceae bacterium]